MQENGGLVWNQDVNFSSRGLARGLSTQGGPDAMALLWHYRTVSWACRHFNSGYFYSWWWDLLEMAWHSCVESSCTYIWGVGMRESWYEPWTKTFPQSRSLPAQEKFQGCSAFLRTRSLRTPVWRHRAIILSPVSWSSDPQGLLQAYLTSLVPGPPGKEMHLPNRGREFHRFPFPIPLSWVVRSSQVHPPPPPPPQSIDWAKEDGSSDRRKW